MRRVFAIRAWSALAPGLQEPAQWWQWARQPVLPQGEVRPDLAHIPPIARRRLGPLARCAVVPADTVLAQAALADLPVVWASRYGDAEKSLALLQAQALGEMVSPTAFGLAVHNGIGAQHSILRGMRANALCVASTDCAPEAGMVEALGLLNEGARQVMLVCYDAPLPPPYDGFHTEPQVVFAWAVLLQWAAPGEPGFLLSRQPGMDAAQPEPAHAPHLQHLPHGLQVLQFLLHDGQASLTGPQRPAQRRGAGGWRWERAHG